MSSETTSSRIITFDFLRGWFLFVITFDHLNRHPALFDLITGKSMLWVTAAEGFFFVSGLLVGLIRGRQAARPGLTSANRKMWGRAAKLYAASVILTLLFTAIAYYLNMAGIAGAKDHLSTFASAGETIWRTLTLQYVYGWTDFLPYYAIFLALSPLALWLLRRGKWWIVLGASLALWFTKSLISDGGLTPYLIWQTYFFGGIVVGFCYDAIRGRYLQLSASRARYLRYGFVISAVATIILCQILTFVPSMVQTHAAAIESAGLSGPAWAAHGAINAVTQTRLYDVLFFDHRGGFLRILVFILWMGAAFLAVRRYERFLTRTIGKVFVPLGANSLYVYIVQGILLFAVPYLMLPTGYVANTLLTIVMIAILWLLVRYRVLFKVIPR